MSFICLTLIITDNPFCPSCGLEVETLKHFFVDCQSYANPRLILYSCLHKFVPDWNSFDNFGNVSLLVEGYKLNHPNLENINPKNIQIFKASMRYIKETCRFINIIIIIIINTVFIRRQYVVYVGKSLD